MDLPSAAPVKHPSKDTSPNKPRRSKRRRAPTGSNDFNVSFSKVKVTESNRVLRSGNSAFHHNSSGIPHDAVSRDHSYSKASKRVSPAREPSTSSSASSADSLKLVIDLTSNEDSSCEGPCKEGDQDFHGSSDIKIIDFDDLELSNLGDRRQDSNSTSVENRNQSPLPRQQARSDNNPIKPSNTSQRDTEAAFNLLENASFLEETNWMLANTALQPTRFDNDEITSSPVYLNLDRHSIPFSSPPTSRHIPSPVNFPSGGCFQRLGPAPPASLNPEHYSGIYPNSGDSSKSREALQMPADQPGWSTKMPPNHAPNFQTLLSSRCTLPTHHIDSKAFQFANSFATSGGSIERILSPVIPKQPSVHRHSHDFSVPFQETNTTMPECPQFDGQSSQHADCRIHLVDTPPSFTRVSQPTPSHPRAQPNRGGANGLITQQDQILFGVGHLKPKRTRRTRAQMQIHRQEMARNCSHRREDHQVNSRNFSMEYHRGPHSHPHEFLSLDRFSSFHRTEAMHQQRYSGAYSMNEANFFDWSQQCDAFSSFSHRVSEVRSLDRLWAALNSLSSADNLQEFHTPPGGSVPNPSSFVWTQRFHAMEMPETNSRRLGPTWQPFTPCEMGHMSSN